MNRKCKKNRTQSTLLLCLPRSFGLTARNPSVVALNTGPGDGGFDFIASCRATSIETRVSNPHAASRRSAQRNFKFQSYFFTFSSFSFTLAVTFQCRIHY